MAEIVRRRSWGGVLPLGRHVSISGSRSIHAPSVSIAPSSFQEEQNARHHKQFKLEQALILPRHKGWGCELTRTQAACTCARPSEVWALWCPYHAQSWTDLAGSHTRADPAAPLLLLRHEG